MFFIIFFLLLCYFIFLYLLFIDKIDQLNKKDAMFSYLEYCKKTS